MKVVEYTPEGKWFMYKGCPNCKASFRYTYSEVYTVEGIVPLQYTDCPVCKHACRHSHATPCEAPKEVEQKLKESRQLDLDREEARKKMVVNDTSLVWWPLLLMIIGLLITGLGYILGKL